MNRIYSVVWSAARNCYVVASEMAKQKTKSASTGKHVVAHKALLVASLLTISTAMTVGAAGTMHVTTSDNGKIIQIGATAEVIPAAEYKSAVVIGHQAKVANTGAIAIGENTNATSESALAMGPRASATAEGALAVGTDTQASAHRAIAFGGNVKATERDTVAIGDQAEATGQYALAVGTWTKATAESALALGVRAEASGDRSIAFGEDAKATQQDTFAIGQFANATGQNALAVGKQASATGSDALSLGTEVKAGGENAIALGRKALANAKNSVVMGNLAGYNNADVGDSSVLIGLNAGSNGNFRVENQEDWGAVYIGQNAGINTKGDASIGIGSDAGRNHTGSQNIFIGDNARTMIANHEDAPDSSTVQNSYSKGSRNITIGHMYVDSKVWERDNNAANKEDPYYINDTISVGNLASAQARQSIAIGSSRKDGVYGAVAAGLRSIAMGMSDKEDNRGAQALAEDAIALGTNAIAGAKNPKKTTASQADTVGMRAIAFGMNANASEADSVAFGQGAKVSGLNSIAFGKGASVTADDSVAFGKESKISAVNAVAVGGGNTVSGTKSSAIGVGNTITSANTLVFGNNVTATTANSIILGDGASGDEVAKTITSATVPAGNGNGTINYSGFAGAVKDTGYYVSIGAKGSERQIKNVAPGEIGHTSTDVINGSQLFATNQVIEKLSGSLVTILGPNTTLNPDGTIISTPNTDGIGGTKKDTIEEAISYLNAGWKLTAAKTTGGEAIGAGEVAVQSDNVVTVEAGKNIKITQDQAKLSIATVDKPSFTTVTATESVQAGTNMLDNTQMKVNNVVMTNVAEAINQIGTQAYKPITFVGDTGTETPITLGEKLNIKGNAKGTLSDENIGVEADTTTNTLTVKLAKKLTGLESVATGNTTMDTTGLTINNGTPDKNVALTQAGLNNGGHKITNVADGQAKSDVATFGQLQATETKLNTSVAAAKTEVAGGNNVTVSSKAGDKGQTVYTVDAAGVNATNDSGLAVTPERDTAGHVTNYQVALSDATKAQLAKEESVIGASSNVVVTSDTANSTGGKEYKVDIAKDLAIDSVTMDKVKLDKTGLTINNGTADKSVTLTSKGLNNGGHKITNVADGQAKSDVATFGQLQVVETNINTSVAAAKTEVAGGNNVTVSSKPGDKGQIVYTVNAAGVAAMNNSGLTINPETDNAGHVTNYQVALSDATKAQLAKEESVTGASSNVVVTSDTANATGGKEYKVDIAKDLAIDSVTMDKVKLDKTGVFINNGVADKNVTLTSKGLNNGGNRITNVADGQDDSDVATYGQLKAVETKINTSVAAVKTEVVGGSNVNVSTTTGDKGQTVYTVNAAGVATTNDSGLAVKPERDTAGHVTNYQVALSEETKKQLAKEESVVAGSTNVVVSADTTNATGGKEYKVDIAKDLTVDSVTMDKVKLDKNGLTIDNGSPEKNVALTQTGLNNGGNRITNVADGKAASDVATFGQLQATEAKINTSVAAAKTEVVGGSNVTVSTATGDKGQTVYTVNAAGVAATNDSGLVVKPESDTAGRVTNYQVALSEETKKQLAKEESVVAGSTNVVVTADTTNATGGKEYKVDIAKELTVTSVKGDTFTAGNTVMNKDGLTAGDTTVTTNGIIIGNKMAEGQNAPAVSLTKTGLDNGGNKITNVQAGELETDAVNVGQLNSVAQGMHSMAREITNVAAQSAALGALKPIQYDPLEPTQIMAGYGYYNGSNAVALGVAHYKNESLMFHAGASWGGANSHLMANAGVTWKFGSRDAEKTIDNLYRRGPISSSYVLQEEVSTMKRQNEELVAENNRLKENDKVQQERIDKMQAQIDMLMARLGM